MKIASLDNPITSRWLAINNQRLDGSPYLTGAIEARAVLDKLTVEKQPLQRLTQSGMGGIYHAGRGERQYVDDPNFGVPFLGSTAILAADLSNLPLISKKQVERNPKLLLKEGHILITRSGTVGRMAYCRPDMERMSGSEDVLRVVANPAKILPGYLYAYLSSRYGVPLVVGGTYGAIIQHIEPSHIANLHVPMPPRDLEEGIHTLIVEAAHCRAQANAAYQTATRQIFETLGWEDPPRYKWLTDTRARSFDVPGVSAGYLRALNFDPRAEALRANLRAGEHSELGSLCDPKRFSSGIIFKRIDAEEEHGVRLVGQRGAFQVRPEGRWLSPSSIEGLGLLVPPGTIVIAAHGTLGETELYCRSVYVTRRTSQYAFSGDFVRCVPLTEKVLPGYLFAFLRSEAAFRLLRSISIGSKQQAPHPGLLWNLPVPRLSAGRENVIHALVEQGAHNFDRALDCEDEAWRRLEHWIEGEARYGAGNPAGRAG